MYEWIYFEDAVDWCVQLRKSQDRQHKLAMGKKVDTILTSSPHHRASIIHSQSTTASANIGTEGTSIATVSAAAVAMVQHTTPFVRGTQ